MSAPSDGARADARKRLAAEVVAPDEQIMRALVARFHDPDVGTWSGHSTVPATCFMCTEAATELGGVIADAKAEALREAADLYRALGDSLPICAGHVVAELDIRADDWARR